MFCQYLSARWLNFAERYGLKSPSAFEPKREASDPAEEIQYTEFHDSLTRSNAWA